MSWWSQALEGRGRTRIDPCSAVAAEQGSRCLTSANPRGAVPMCWFDYVAVRSRGGPRGDRLRWRLGPVAPVVGWRADRRSGPAAGSVGRPVLSAGGGRAGPRLLIDVCWQHWYLAVWVFDPARRRTGKVDFRRLEDERVFLARDRGLALCRRPRRVRRTGLAPHGRHQPRRPRLCRGPVRRREGRCRFGWRTVRRRHAVAAGTGLRQLGAAV